jgi:hypothetical protein
MKNPYCGVWANRVDQGTTCDIDQSSCNLTSYLRALILTAHFILVLWCFEYCSRHNNEASSRRFSLASEVTHRSQTMSKRDRSGEVTHRSQTMSKRARAARQQLTVDQDANDGCLPGLGSDSGVAATGAAAAAAAGDPTAVLADVQSPPDDSDFSADQDDTDGNSSSTDEDEVQPVRKKAAKGSNSAAAAAKASKQRKKQKAPKKPQQESKGPRIGAKKAKKVYCLDDSDLDKMQDTKIVVNMFFGGKC